MMLRKPVTHLLQLDPSFSRHLALAFTNGSWHFNSQTKISDKRFYKRQSKFICLNQDFLPQSKKLCSVSQMDKVNANCGSKILPTDNVYWRHAHSFHSVTVSSNVLGENVSASNSQCLKNGSFVLRRSASFSPQGILEASPPALQPYMRLIRFDKPIGNFSHTLYRTCIIDHIYVLKKIWQTSGYYCIFVGVVIYYCLQVIFAQIYLYIWFD